MKRRAPPVQRNREPILGVLREVLPAAGSVLEIASGTGEHAVFFSQAFPSLCWQPTDVDPDALESIAAWREDAGLANLLPPVRFDVCDTREVAVGRPLPQVEVSGSGPPQVGGSGSGLPRVEGSGSGPPQVEASGSGPPQIEVSGFDAIVCINMVHISPWEATLGLMRAAGRLLAPGGVLYLYGPYLVPGVETAPSNLAFDASLKERNAAWGLRDLDAVTHAAEANGLVRERVVAMPSNNLSVVFRREPGSGQR